MFESLKSNIERKIAALKIDIDKCKAKLDENYVFNFEWGYAENLYLATLQSNILSEFLAFFTENPERAGEWLTHNINRIKNEILQGGFVGTSTNQFSFQYCF